MQTKQYADSYNETSLFKKVHKKEIEKYQKVKDSIRDILKEYPELKTFLGKSFNKDSFKKLNERLDNLEKEIENLKQIYIFKIEEKEQFEKLIKNYEDYPIHHGDEKEVDMYSADARQFITFQTKNGKTFHLIINHDEDSENVMLLMEVSEDNLLNMVEKKETPKQEITKEETVKKEVKPEKKEEKKVI